MSVNDNETQFTYALQEGYQPYFDIYRSFSAAQRAAELKLAGEIRVGASRSPDMWYVCGENPKTPDTEESYYIVKKPILG